MPAINNPLEIICIINLNYMIERIMEKTDGVTGFFVTDPKRISIESLRRQPVDNTKENVGVRVLAGRMDLLHSFNEPSEEDSTFSIKINATGLSLPKDIRSFLGFDPNKPDQQLLVQVPERDTLIVKMPGPSLNAREVRYLLRDNLVTYQQIGHRGDVLKQFVGKSSIHDLQQILNRVDTQMAGPVPRK